MLVDTHCHLDFEAFDQDRSEVIRRAREIGIYRMLNPGIDISSSLAAIRLAETFADVNAAVGVHPNSSTSWTEETANQLTQLAQHEKVVAIGEIGLDYYRDRAPLDVQKFVLHRQLAIAAEVGLPVIIHMRNQIPQENQASIDMLQILAEWCNRLKIDNSPLVNRPGVLHSFSSTTEDALQAIELGFHIGITGPITFKSARQLQATVASISIDHLLIETDAPFLTPHPHRSQRNEPAYVQLVAGKIADVQQLPLEKVINGTTSNAEKLFNW